MSFADHLAMTAVSSKEALVDQIFEFFTARCLEVAENGGTKISWYSHHDGAMNRTVDKIGKMGWNKEAVHLLQEQLKQLGFGNVFVKMEYRGRHGDFVYVGAEWPSLEPTPRDLDRSLDAEQLADIAVSSKETLIDQIFEFFTARCLEIAELGGTKVSWYSHHDGAMNETVDKIGKMGWEREAVQLLHEQLDQLGLGDIIVKMAYGGRRGDHYMFIGAEWPSMEPEPTRPNHSAVAAVDLRKSKSQPLHTGHAARVGDGQRLRSRR